MRPYLAAVGAIAAAIVVYAALTRDDPPAPIGAGIEARWRIGSSRPRLRSASRSPTRRQSCPANVTTALSREVEETRLLAAPELAP